MTKRFPDAVYEQIKQKIIEGEYYPSQRLVEEQLAQSFAVGRHSVRMALQRLQTDGLVTIEPNRGASVTALSLEDALDTLIAREVLEVAAAVRAVDRITEDQLNQLEECVEMMATALQESDFDTYSQVNKRLHGIVYDAAGTHSIPWLIGLLRARLARLQLRTILVPGRSTESLAEHRALYQALRARDAAAAAAAAKKHIGNLRTTIQKAWSLVRL